MFIMSTIQPQLSLAHHPRWLVVLRVALGCCLYKRHFYGQRRTDKLYAAASPPPWIAIGITGSHTWRRLIIIGLHQAGRADTITHFAGRHFLYQPATGINVSELLLSMAGYTLLLFLVEGSGPISP